MPKKKTTKKGTEKTDKDTKVKKTSQAKTKKSKTGSARQKDLQKELNSLVKQLNEEQLEALVQQGKSLIHNARVMEEYTENRMRAEEMYKSTGQKVPKGDVTIEESDDDSYFVIVVNNYRNFLERGEMKKIVSLCHDSDGKDDAARRLFNWFNRERIDILNNSSIGNANDPTLKKLYTLIIKTYTVS